MLGHLLRHTQSVAELEVVRLGYGHFVKAAFILIRYVGLPFIIFVASIAIFVTYPMVFGGIVLLALLYITFSYFRVRQRLRTLGFRVTRTGRDGILYEELFDQRLRSLKIQGEMQGRAPDIVYIPSEVDWLATMPDWAKERRTEILQRVRQELGTQNYTYQEAASAFNHSA